MELQLFNRICDFLNASTLTARNYRLLTLLHDGPLTMTDLASKLRVSTAAMTCIMDRMEELELAERFKTSDRRAVFVNITDAGRAYVQQIVDAEEVK